MDIECDWDCEKPLNELSMDLALRKFQWWLRASYVLKAKPHMFQIVKLAYIGMLSIPSGLW